MAFGPLGIAALPAAAEDGSESRAARGAIGPDVIVLNIPHVQLIAASNGFSAYAVGTTACNPGDVPAEWINDASPDGNRHPVIAQNIYRLHGGRFEQIGMAWLKHGFCALNEVSCGACQNTDCESLGVNCADTYSGFQNALQNDLGPRSQVNAVTGAFPYPFSAPLYTGDLARRLIVANDDMDPALYPGAQFYAEGHYVSPDDAAAGNSLNNVSYRRFAVTAEPGGGWDPTVVGPTQLEQPAIMAWAANDAGVSIASVDIPGDGRVFVGWKVTDLGDGAWRYEYAVYNMNSDRSVRSFSLPYGGGPMVTSVGFHDVDYHSGEPFDGTDWPMDASGGVISWATDEFDVNTNGNALRWSTLYNFRFDAQVAPGSVTATLGLFKPGSPAAVTVSVLGPIPECAPGDADCDGEIDLADFAALQACFDKPGNEWGPFCELFDSNEDGVIDLVDFVGFLGNLSGP